MAEPNHRAPRDFIPHLAQLVARLADDDNGAEHVRSEHHAHFARADPRADKIREPARRLVGPAFELSLGRLIGRYLDQISLAVGRQDARVANILELSGYRVEQLLHLRFGCQALDHVTHELLRQLHR